MGPWGGPGAHGAHDHGEERGEPLPSSIKGHFELVPLLLRGLKSEDSAIRARSAFCLGQVGKRSTADDVRPLLGDPDKAVRYQAGIALCRCRLQMLDLLRCMRKYGDRTRMIPFQLNSFV